MNENAFRLLVSAARAAVNHLKACEAGMIRHPFKSRSLPLLQEALAEAGKDDNRTGLDPEAAKVLVKFVTLNMERESRFLSPDPQAFMNNPYGLLDVIRELWKLKPEKIDEWMVEAQGGLPREKKRRPI